MKNLSSTLELDHVKFRQQNCPSIYRDERHLSIKTIKTIITLIKVTETKRRDSEEKIQWENKWRGT